MVINGTRQNKTGKEKIEHEEKEGVFLIWSGQVSLKR